MVFRLQGSDPATWNAPWQISCGQCIGCRLDWAGDWAARCEKEAKLYEHNRFITLTYDDAHLPIGGGDRSTLVKRDYQLFMKRLRKAYPTNAIRFFAVGEYGEVNQRAHFHALLFNHHFPDERLWKPSKRFPLYLSQHLQELWGHGFTSVGSVSFQSAAYVARYVIKKLTGKRSDYLDRERPFVLMSRRPGIGSAWFEKYKDEIYPKGELVVGEGKLRRTPRYFDNKYREWDPDGYFKLKLERRLVATQDTNNSRERLAVREHVAKANLKQLKRNL